MHAAPRRESAADFRPVLVSEHEDVETLGRQPLRESNMSVFDVASIESNHIILRGSRSSVVGDAHGNRGLVLYDYIPGSGPGIFSHAGIEKPAGIRGWADSPPSASIG